MKECVVCLKRKEIYQSCMCQECYREKLREYSYREYKDRDKMSGNILKICELYIEYGLTTKEIANKLGLNRNYIQQVINKNTYRVNSKGERRPF